MKRNAESEGSLVLGVPYVPAVPYVPLTASLARRLLERAIYEMLEDEEPYYGEIPGFRESGPRRRPWRDAGAGWPKRSRIGSFSASILGKNTKRRQRCRSHSRAASKPSLPQGVSAIDLLNSRRYV